MSIAIVNPIPMITIGGVSVPASRALILSASCVSGSYDTFRLDGTAYQVPVGKKLVARAVWFISRSSTVAETAIGDSDASVSNSTIPSGWAVKDVGGVTGDYYAWQANIVGEVSGCPANMSFAAGKYPGVLASGGTTYCRLLATLENA